MITTPISRIETLVSSRDEIVRMLSHAPKSGSGAGKFFDINGEGLSLYYRNAKYRAALDQADAVHADGWIIVAASRWLTKRPIVERSATTDLIHDYARIAAANGQSIFLLGGEPGLADSCADELLRAYPSLQIAGTHHGFFEEEQTSEVISKINDTKPHTVWVGLGKPKEVIFCAQYANSIDADWLVNCGGCFNFVVGNYKRAPVWMQNTGLEWLHRLYREPKRLFWRYALTNSHSLYLLLTKTSAASQEP